MIRFDAKAHSMTLFEIFRKSEEEISKIRGEFTLFGLFEREDIPGKFDAIASAEWLKNDRASLIFLADFVTDTAGGIPYMALGIGKFVILGTRDTFVMAVLRAVPTDFVQHDIQPLRDLLYEGDIIKNSVIITAIKHPIQNMTSVAG
jgi:hypothetical protein